MFVIYESLICVIIYMALFTCTHMLHVLTPTFMQVLYNSFRSVTAIKILWESFTCMLSI